MEEGSSTPLFIDGQETSTFLASCKILFNAWEESGRANNSESFSLEEHGGVAYVAFPSFLRIESFIDGEGNIETNNQVFLDCLKGYDDKPALVHQGALKLFLDIMEKTDFQAKIDQLQASTDSRQRKFKPIIFVGHSLGGAVATLATLWFLEKRLRQISTFCITFGCPLVGDERLVEAVGREKWGGNFCHVVSEHDIVPRMLLAPLEVISVPLTAILPFWHGKIPYSSIKEACRILLNNVLQYTSNYMSDSQKWSDRATERIPYRPVGTYMFCSSHGAYCIENSDTVLKMLHLTMQSHENPSDITVEDYFSEHIGYDSALKRVIENPISGKRFGNPDSKSSYEMGISVQLEAIGAGAQNDHARFALRKAGRNVDQLAIELSKKQCSMAELEWYKVLSCEKKGDIGYYDSFKGLHMKRDINANVRRLKLTQFWDEIIEMWERHELPSDFQFQNKWINAGTAYRRLVEPLDIAYYYRMSKGKGNYLSDGRPKRHKVLQEWMEAKEKTRSSRSQKIRTKPASLTEDSCFWAYVEEARKDLENLKQGQHQSLQSLEEFEKYVTTMVKALSISSDVFLEGSSFMMWWEEWKEYNKNQSPDWSSPLRQIMENLSVSFEHSMTWSRALHPHKRYPCSPPSEWSPPSNILTMGGALETYERDPWSPPSESSSPSNILTIGGALETYERDPWSAPSESSSPSNILTIGGLANIQESSTHLRSSGLQFQASERSCLAINSESLRHSVGQETATFLASCGILSQAWQELCLAINSKNFSLNEHEGVAYVVFPSFHDIEGFIVKDSKYGACNIQTDNNVFSGCLKGNDDQLALVHHGALKLLLHIMESTDFHAKLQIYTDSKQRKLKPIVFVGHSLGGAVATLATLWVLEKRLRQSSPFCITFGSPLVGDARLVEAVGRENWGGHFCHVVSKNDIVPRVLLAPFESTSEPLNALLPYWLAKITNDRNDGPDFLIQDAYKALLLSVCESDTSPYKPFGTFMFCSSNGAACIANSKTVLEILLLTIQSQETSSEKSRQDCLLEHIRYGSILEHVIQNSTRGIMGISASSNSESSDEMGISLELEAVGIGAQNHLARIAIQEAGYIENKHNTNVTKLAIELRQQQCAMAALEWYKERCEMEKLFYYDSFKNREDDMDAPNLLRLQLGEFWDEIIEMWDRHELPSDFQSQNKWINAGNTYRRLVEPLDIAHYYRTCQGNDNYLSNGRPNRHKVLQKWMEEKEKTRGPVPSLSRKNTSSPLKKIPSLSRDSCFCAHVEEALKDFEHLQRGEYGRLKSLEEFEHYVTRMIKERGVSSDVIARIGADSAPSSLHHLSSGSPLEVLRIKVSSPNTS